MGVSFEVAIVKKLFFLAFLSSKSGIKYIYHNIIVLNEIQCLSMQILNTLLQ